MNIEDEQYALIYYILNKKPGPVITKIIEERIKWLENRKHYVFPEPRNINAGSSIRCIHHKTRVKYDSITEAARDLKIRYKTLQDDINDNVHAYGVYKLHD